MRYLSLQDLRQPVSVIGLGTSAFAPDIYDRAATVLDAFLEAGGNCIDTAHIYGFGKSEQAVGRWIKERGRREDIILVGKGCHPLVDPENVFGKEWQPRVTPEAIRSDLNESLERLQTDSIDVYLIHRDDEKIPVAALIEALSAERARGRIHAFGVSNWRVERIAEANAYAAKHGLSGFVISSNGFSLPRPRKMFFPGTRFADMNERAWYARHQFPLLAWSSLGAGFMNGKYTREHPGHDVAAQMYSSPENFERLRRAQALAAQKRVTPVQIGLAYVLRQAFPIIALAGPTTVQHLNEILGALNVELNVQDMQFLESVKGSQ